MNILQNQLFRLLKIKRVLIVYIDKYGKWTQLMTKKKYDRRLKAGLARGKARYSLPLWNK
jgi:hypothetical protein